MQAKQWRVRPLDDGADESRFQRQVEALSLETGLSPLTTVLCLKRGLATKDAIHHFLNPSFESIRSPFSIADMDRAVDRLLDAWTKGEKILVFGDYDVDGTTGSALLAWVFRACGMSYEVRQPDRFKDGYGLNTGAVAEAAASGVSLLVTVDCGITSFDAIALAKQKNVDVIVVDHHQVDPVKGLPQAFAVVNPQRADCQSGLKQLCGCGLAFYLAIALRSRARERGFFKDRPEPNLKQHLDLVVLATAADMVPLTGDNHILVRHGMDVLRVTKKPGLKALLDAAHINPETVSPGSLGFVIGPRINASGRMQSASLALELLTTEDAQKGRQLAQELEKLNEERAEVQNAIWDEVRKQVEEGIAAGRFKNAVVVGNSSWHEGVVGIVASRVTDTFHRPAAVIALRPEGGKGSVRSYGAKNVLEGMRVAGSHLLGFGGHKHAAGLSILPENLDAFAQAFDQAMGEIVPEKDTSMLWLDGECELTDFSMKTLQEIEKMGPFGPGNSEPVFSFPALLRNQQIVKGRHLRYVLERSGASGAPTAQNQTVSGIWFHAAERSTLPKVGEQGRWAGIPEINRFQGRVTPSIRIKDWQPL